MKDACTHAMYASMKTGQVRTLHVMYYIDHATHSFCKKKSTVSYLFCRWALQWAKLTGIPPPCRTVGDNAADKRRSRQRRLAVIEATNESLDSLPFCLSQEEQQECRADMQAARTTGLLTTQLFSSSIWNMYGKSWACKTHDFVLLSGPLQDVDDVCVAEQAVNWPQRSSLHAV